MRERLRRWRGGPYLARADRGTWREIGRVVLADTALALSANPRHRRKPERRLIDQEEPRSVPLDIGMESSPRAPPSSARLERHLARDTRAVARRRLDCQAPAQELGALAYSP